MRLLLRAISERVNPRAGHEGATPMNYRLGLFRVWIVFSVIWSAVVLIVALSDHDRRYGFFVIDKAWQAGNYEWLWWFWEEWLVAIFAPWVWVIWTAGRWMVLSVIGSVVRWTVRGFRSN
jgi:hypothetical protein